MKNIIRTELEQLAEDNYRIFSSKLIPNIDNLLGVRIPTLRKMAKLILQDRDNWQEYVSITDTIYFEETILQGMIIGHAKISIEEKLVLITNFIPKINNWSVCDSFCSGLKIKEKEKPITWDFIQPYLKSDEPYEIRFGVVILLSYFVDVKYTQEAFVSFDNIKHEDYYVKMAVAWAISIYFIKLRAETLPYLLNNKLDDWTYNKALQKIIESQTTDASTKDLMRSMKRKTSKKD